MRNFFKGVGFAAAGIKYFYSDRQLWKYILPIWGILSLFYAVLLWGTFKASHHLVRYASSCIQNWPEFLRIFLEYSITAAVIIALLAFTATTFTTFFEAVGGLFFDRLIITFEKKYFKSEFTETSFARQFFFTMQSVWFGVKSVMLLLILIAAGFFLPAAGPLLLIIIMGRRMALSLIYPAGFLHGQNIHECNKLLKGRQTELLGFGVAVYLLQLLPFTVLFTLPGLVLGAAIFFNGKIPSDS